MNDVNDAISRQQAIDAMAELQGKASTKAELKGISKAWKRIKKLPPIQSKKGYWIEADVCGDITSWECSCCHNWTGLPTGWNVKAKLWFCPKCTADMREDCEKE